MQKVFLHSTHNDSSSWKDAFGCSATQRYFPNDVIYKVISPSVIKAKLFCLFCQAEMTSSSNKSQMAFSPDYKTLAAGSFNLQFVGNEAWAPSSSSERSECQEFPSLFSPPWLFNNVQKSWKIRVEMKHQYACSILGFFHPNILTSAYLQVHLLRYIFKGRRKALNG